MTRIEKQERIEELKTDLGKVREAINAIISGKKQSYSVGTRSASAYPMSLGDLQKYRSKLIQEISDLEAELAGKSSRLAIKFAPRY